MQSNISGSNSLMSRVYDKYGIHITVNLPDLTEAQRTKTDIQIKDKITETVRQSISI